MKYISVGQTSLDRSYLPDGRVAGPYLGGTAIFGYGGIRVWEDDCLLLTNVAQDFYDYFGEWIQRNHIDCSGITTLYDHTHTVDMIYRDNGYYESVKSYEEKLHSAFAYGLSNCRADQIDTAAANAQGVYLYMEPVEKVFWKNLRKVKDGRQFELMWEPGFSKCEAHHRQAVLDIYKVLRPEMSSLNHFEACILFETQEVEQIFAIIEALEIPFFFYRAGKKGAYALHNGNRYFVPSIDIDSQPAVDPAGCGNTTTAAAMYGWVRTKNPVMATIIANISGGFNVRQYGPIASFTPEERQMAEKLAIETYNSYLAQHPECLLHGLEADGAKVLAGGAQTKNKTAGKDFYENHL